jgi:outer membrane protein assembly factor BamB
MTLSRAIFLTVLFCGISSALCMAQEPAPRDWTTWGYDQERSAWNKGEKILSASNVRKLRVSWSTKLSTPPTDIALSTLTAPLVVEGVSVAGQPRNLVFVLGADDTLFAADADSGKLVWQKSFPPAIKPLRPATWLCSNTANDTPVIDKKKGIIFFVTSDGKMHGLALGDGAERLVGTEFLAPFARAWSLNLIDDVIYTTNARSCGNAPGQQPAQPPIAGAPPAGPVPPKGGVEASISAMDVSDLSNPRVNRFYTSSTREAGPWGRGGVQKTPKGIITQTADGQYDPAGGEFGEAVLELAPRLAGLVDSFTPANWKYLNLHDLDMGSASQVVFPFGDKLLTAVASKEGVIYLLDIAHLGGIAPDHSTPFYKSQKIANDDAFGGNTPAPGQGVWGSITTYLTPDGRRFLYVPVWGPPSKDAPPFKNAYGPIANGSIMAFEVVADGKKVSLVSQWSSPNMTVPDSPVAANGVLYALETGEQTRQNSQPPGQPRLPIAGAAKFRATPVGNLVLRAFDAETGKTLYSSKNILTDWVHFSEPVVALGKVFVVTHDAHLYAFGLK